MSEQHQAGAARAFLKLVVQAIGVMASIAAVGGLGWWAAIAYYDFSTMTGTVYTSAKLTEKSLEADDFRQRLTEASDKIEELQKELVIARATPTDADWNTLCHSFLKIYGVNISSPVEINNWIGEFGRVTDDQNRKFKKLSHILNGLWDAKARTNSYLVGAGLMKSVNLEGVEYIILKKYPSHGVNWKTGEVKELDKE